MKNYCAVSLLLITASCSDNSNTREVANVAEEVPFIDSENGFRNHHFGDHISTFKGIKFLKKADSNGVKIYGLVEGYESDWKLENITLNSIAYYFKQDSLCQVMLVCNAEHSNELLRVAKERYGDYTQIVPNKKVYHWQGKKEMVTYMPPSNGDRENSSVLITSVAMSSRLKGKHK